MKKQSKSTKSSTKKHVTGKSKMPKILDIKGNAGGKAALPPTLKGLLRPVRSAKSAKRHLAKLLVALYKNEVEPVKVRTAVYVLSLFLHAIEVNELEARIETLLKHLKK